jgi:group I intron endonuclease
MISTNELPITPGIYRFTSPSNKVYIGQAVNIKKRFCSYRYLNCKTQIKLYRSFLKYGFEKHKFEILEECSREKLNECEIFHKKEFIEKSS